MREIYFVLVEPAVSGNIGAAARALKTMGHEKLVLVNPAAHFNDQAKMLGHGSWEILENARIYKSFEEAIQLFDFVIGTSAKSRSIKHDYYTIEQAKQIADAKLGAIQKIALVFGREESGLTNQELHNCDIISYVPLATTYPSLNLAQAVMLYSFLFSSYSDVKSNEPLLSDNQKLYNITKNKASDALSSIAISKDSTLHNRIMERIALLNADDLHLILSVCNKILEKN